MNTTNNQKAVDLFNKLADSYQERFFSVAHYSKSLELFLSYLKDDASILDVACGPGNISHFLLERKPCLKLLGIDLAPKMIELARTNNPNAQFLICDALQIDSLDSTFEAIVIGFLFPYLSMEQVELLLIKIHEKLRERGIIYLSTMEDLHEKSGPKTSSTGEELMMYYYEADFLNRLLKQIGFQIIKVHRQPFTVSETDTDTDLIIIAQKQDFLKNH